MQETYNSEYKRNEIEHHNARSQIRKDQLVHPEDFNVCPKYLATATEFDEMASFHTETKRFRESKRNDSSEKKVHLHNTYAEDRISFIHNYNDLVIENKKLWRKIGELRQQFRSINERPDSETRFSLTRHDAEESGNKLSVKPQHAPKLDVAPEFRHLSPIAGDRQVFATPPDHDQAKLKKTGNHSSLNFNLTSTAKKPGEDDACVHAVKAYNAQREVDKLEAVVQNQFETIQRLSQGNTPVKKVSFSHEKPPIVDGASFQARITHLEEANAELSRLLEEAQSNLSNNKRRFEQREASLLSENESLLKENKALADDKMKLMAEINALKQETQIKSPRKEHGKLQDQTAIFLEYEREAKKLRDHVQKLVSDNEELELRLARKEDALKKSSEVVKLHESTIMDLHSDVVKLAGNARTDEKQTSMLYLNQWKSQKISRLELHNSGQGSMSLPKSESF